MLEHDLCKAKQISIDLKLLQHHYHSLHPVMLMHGSADMLALALQLYWSLAACEARAQSACGTLAPWLRHQTRTPVKAAADMRLMS